MSEFVWDDYCLSIFTIKIKSHANVTGKLTSFAAEHLLCGHSCAAISQKGIANQQDLWIPTKPLLLLLFLSLIIIITLIVMYYTNIFQL